MLSHSMSLGCDHYYHQIIQGAPWKKFDCSGTTVTRSDEKKTRDELVIVDDPASGGRGREDAEKISLVYA